MKKDAKTVIFIFLIIFTGAVLYYGATLFLQLETNLCVGGFIFLFFIFFGLIALAEMVLKKL